VNALRLIGHLLAQQASACLFGLILLAAILLTHWWLPPWGIARYDLLFGVAVVTQAVFLACRLEEPREALVILIFHVVGTLMELFKTADGIGAWQYPGDAVLRIGAVPLFAGFMYSAVGSWLARMWRIHDFRFERFPAWPIAFGLALLAYLNFFTHHFIWDVRWPLLLVFALAFGPCWLHLRLGDHHRRVPLALVLVGIAAAIWLAENIATWARIWLYPSQIAAWHPVPPAKLTAWLLLMLLSFVLVALVRRPTPPDSTPG
jgi:uncharacterized membrane protein YoaT (DUF817 family)